MSSPLRTAIRQEQPAEGPEEEAFLNILRTHGVLLGPLARLLREKNLTHAQYNILRILRGAGRLGLACQEIGERMVTREPDLTRLLDRLEEAQLVTRQRSTRDRRVVEVRLTDSGRRLLKRLDVPVMKTVRFVLGHLSSKELREISRLMVKACQIPAAPAPGQSE